MVSDAGDGGRQRGGKGAEVVCAWCGCVIRSAVAKAAQRMCQPCFAHLMREYGRVHRQRTGSRDASER